MIEKHVQKFIEEVQKFQYQSFPIDTNELRAKAVTLLEGFIFKNLKITNPGSYSLIFSVNFIPVELHSLHQVKCALAMLIDLIGDGEYLDLPYSNELNSSKYFSRTEKSIRESFDVYEELFSKYPGEIDAIVKDLNRYAARLSEEGLIDRLRKFDDDLIAEIDYLENLLEDILTWDDFRLYYGNEADVMVARLQRIISSKISKRSLLQFKDQIRKDNEEENAFPEFFAKNGFRLFDYLLQKEVRIGHGFQADVIHFFRLMEEDELVKMGDTQFKIWFGKKYPDQEWIGRMRKLEEFNGTKDLARERIYREAKRLFGFK